MKEKLTTKSACPTLLSFRQLVQHIRQLNTSLRREEIESLLARVFVTRKDYEEFITDAEPYGRISVVKSELEFAELLVMTWKQNQESPIHDHFQSACGIRILEGTMTETLYEIVNSDKVRRSIVQAWSENEITSSDASFDIHKVANTHEATLVTLHIYSVPLDIKKMRRFIEIEMK